MANTKRIVVFIILSILFILLQTPVGFAQESSSSGDKGSVSSDVTYTESTGDAVIPPPPPKK